MASPSPSSDPDPSPRVGAAIGLDMGGTKTAGLLLTADGQVVGSHTLPTPSRQGPAAVLATLEEVTENLLTQAQQLRTEVVAIGVGVPGLVSNSGQLCFAGHLGGEVGLDLAALLPARFMLPTVVANDNTCAGYAEWTAGAGRGFDDVLYVGLGTGIGGGIIAGGVAQRGANGFAGEVGHIVIDRNGELCTCGRRGCWELSASGTALGRQGEQAIVDGRWNAAPDVVRPVSGTDVMDQAALGVNAAVEVVEAFAGHLAVGLVDLALVLDPACIVLGGGVMTRAELLLPSVREQFRVLLGDMSSIRGLPELRAAHFGPRSGAVGAALLALALVLR